MFWNILYFLVLLTVGVCDPACNTYTDCASCSAATSRIWWMNFDCLWCPLDNRCHTWGSQYTPCIEDMNINQPAQCLSEAEGTYDPDKAYVHTLLSSAAYGLDVQQCLGALDPTADFDVRHVIAVRCDGGSSDYDECIGYTAVSVTRETIYVAFRGTDTDEQGKDQVLAYLTLENTSIRPGGTVMNYFGQAYNALYPCVQSQFQALRLQYPSYKVVITGHSFGHSFGGALASITAASLIYDGDVAASNLELYTFGMPRVGDKRYAYEFDRLVRNSWHVANYRDPVAHAPPCNFLGCNTPYDGPFHHKREVYYPDITGDMKVDSPYTLCYENEDETCSNGAISNDPCLSAAECSELHTIYFNVDVGGSCGSLLGNTALPRPWNNLLTRQCSTFNV